MSGIDASLEGVIADLARTRAEPAESWPCCPHCDDVCISGGQHPTPCPCQEPT